ncbi:hypothetical protein WJU16_15385 [Chitinophaga pollutisoli]|uniref:Peptidase M48 domain-containing protein n=1 Tax=Chitinophaga pollutisoli TaxID=3133966 RepID=A0ABZ2YJ79_9BACT
MNAALLPEYSIRSAESAVNAEKIRRSVFRLTRVYLWLFIIAVVVINLQYFFMGPESAEYDDFLYPGYSLGRSFQAEVMHLMYINSILGMAGSIGTAMLLFASIKEGMGKFESDVNAGRVTEMQPEQGVSIREMTEALATDMGILPENRIRFWKTLSKARYPSVQQLGGGDVNIVVPVNYFLFHQKHPERSKAILAHELGHVLQGDTDLYLLSEKFYTVVRLVVVPMLLLTLISVLVMLAMSGGPQGGLSR